MVQVKAFPHYRTKVEFCDKIKGQILSWQILSWQILSWQILSWQIYVPSAASALKIRLICSWPASIVAKGFYLQFTRFILSRFKILECPSFAARDNLCLSSKLIWVKLHAFRSFYDKWSTRLSRFCSFNRFCPVFTQCRRFVWRFDRFGQNLSSRDKPSALVKFDDDRKFV